MPYSVPIEYDDLFEFLEDYRTNISQMQYTVPTDRLLPVGEEVAVQFTVPVLGEAVTAHGRVMHPADDTAGLQLDPDHGDGIPRLEGFYRFVGSLVEAMLVSGRFKVAGQWAEGAAPMRASAAAAAQSEDGSRGLIDTTLLGEPKYSGDVDETAMTQVLMDLYRTSATGVFEVRSETGRRLGWMKKGGFVQWANDPVIEEECLGVLLARAGKLNEEQLRTSLQRMNDTGQRQGECLIELGALTFPQLVMSLMTQTEIITRNVFAIADGTFAFYELDKLPGDFVTPPMKSPGFLFGYYKRRVGSMSRSQLDTMQAPLMDQYTKLNPDVNWDDLRMKKPELALIDILRRKSYRYREVFSVSNMGRNQTMPVLLALVQLGVLEFASAEDSTQVMERYRTQLETKLSHQREQNPFETLEVHWTSRTPQVQAAYERMKTEYERFGRGKTLAPDVEERRQKILTNIKRAYDQLAEKQVRQATRKKHYEPQQHAFSSDLLFRQGEMLLMRHKYADAVENLERALELSPGNPKFKQMLATARRGAGAGD